MAVRQQNTKGWFDMIHPELKAHCDRMFIAQTKFEEARLAGEQARHRNYRRLIWLAVIIASLAIGLKFLDLTLATETILAVLLAAPYLYVLITGKSAEKKLSEESHRRFNHMAQLRTELPVLCSRLKNSHISQLERDMILVDWQGKPAVVFSGSHAYAIVKPEGDWIEVDGTGVLNTGKIISDAETFDQMFKEQYGYLGSVQKFPAKLVWEDEADMFDDREYLAYLERQRNLAGG